MIVTMFTDASWCPDTKLAGWAVWFKYDGEMRRFSGISKFTPATSGIAELGAVVNGLWLLDRENPAAPGRSRDFVIVQSDCLEAFDYLRGGKPSENADALRLTGQAREIISRRYWLMDYRHVKGHVGRGRYETPEGRRTQVQYWCDRAAREEMRSARDKLKEKAE